MDPVGAGKFRKEILTCQPLARSVLRLPNSWLHLPASQKQWTQSFAAGRRSRKSGIKSKQFTFYNPLLQNEGHAKALVNLGIVGRWWLRPIVVFVGDAELKTADKFLPFDEHEKIASQNRAWRMRGVICMSLADLHRYTTERNA